MFWMKRNLTIARTPRTTVMLAAGGLAALNVVMTVTAQQPKAPAGQASVGVAPSSVASAGAKGDGQPIDLPPGSFETLPNGYRRVYHSQAQSLSADDLAQLIAAGKTEGLNGKQRVMSTFTDYLPENWMDAARQAAPGMRVDSYGNPIVNEPFALPGWAQHDVLALRDEIGDWLLHLDNLDLALAGHADQVVQIPPRARPQTYQRDAANLETDRFESQHILGNYVAQAIVRQIDISDIMPLDHLRMTPDVVNSLAQYFHFYEGLKADEAARNGAAWSPEVYPAEIVALLESHGHAMNHVLSLENQSEDEGGIAGAGGCYNTTTSAVGATFHVDSIGIWNGIDTPQDDAQADVNLGFRYYYQPCETGFYNNAVRVSSNGYISFFQQGGNAGNGLEYNNLPLPTVGGVDGFAAPWWDDLIVANQGVLDEVSYKVEGAVGFRVVSIEYFSVSHYSGGTDEHYYFQVRLIENNGAMQFHYDLAHSPDPTVDSRTSGIENFAGNAADCGDGCGNSIAGGPVSNYTFGFPAMPNDGCLSAQCLEEDQVVEGHNFGAGGSDLSTCVAVDFPDVWYSYRAPIAGTVTVSLCSGGDGYDSTLSVFDACNGNQVACDDDGCISPSSLLNFNSVAGVNYLIRVSGYESSRGLFAISVNIGAEGDTCANPHPITIPGTGVNFYSTFNNTGCGDETSCGSGDTVDEWLAWTAPSTGQVQATTCAGSTDFDTTLAVYSGACSSLTQLACNDDAAPFCNGELTSRIAWAAQAGTTYLLRVAGAGGAIGEYDIEIGYDDTCPGDVAPSGGDGVVDVDDVVAVILAWGPCSGCAEDFVPAGGNGQVDVDDLVGVILAWGICQ